MAGRIVVLNGVGSAGKSSIARALQQIARDTWLHVEMDAFLDMLPPRLLDHPDGYRFEAVSDDGHAAVAIHEGPAGARLMRGMRKAIAAMANEGNNLIVDDVLLGDSRAAYEDALKGLSVVYVGVHASLAVLEAREKARGDRLTGLARWQYHRVHAGMTYDFEVDSTDATPEACAEAIRSRFDL